MSERDPEVGFGENDPPDRGSDQPDSRRWFRLGKILPRREPSAKSSDEDSDSLDYERFGLQARFVTSSDSYSSSYESSDFDDDTSEYSSGEVDIEDRDDLEASSSSAGSDSEEAAHQNSEVKIREENKNSFFKLVENKDITKLKDFLDKLESSDKEYLCQATDEKDLTALHLAAIYNSGKVAKILPRFLALSDKVTPLLPKKEI